jgi:hypothetical protein
MCTSTSNTQCASDTRINLAFPHDIDSGMGAENYVVLAGAAITLTGDAFVYGNMGVSPGTSITGGDQIKMAAYGSGTPFDPSNALTSHPSGNVAAGIEYVKIPGFGSDQSPDGVTPAAAKLALDYAYGYAAGLDHDTLLVPAVYIVYGQPQTTVNTLGPGIYKAPSSFAVGPVANLYLDATGEEYPEKAVWIFQIGSTLKINVGCEVRLRGGAKAANVFWQVGSSATLLGGSVTMGTVMAMASITTANGARGAIVHGRLLARTAAVTFTGSPFGVALTLPTIAVGFCPTRDFG